MATRRRLATDNTHRFCSRCRLELTDIASRNLGYGPSCALKNSHLMAKAVPANYSSALVFAMAIHDTMLAPETVETWHKAYKNLMKCSEKAAIASTDFSVMTQTGNDLREVIRACDFLCSFDHPNAQSGGAYVNVKNSMIQIIRALGYVGLAGVIAGQASTSASKIWFEKGRVYMTGLGNTSGWQTMKKIPGITVPRFRGDRSPYSAPVSSMTAFFDAVQAHWPMYEGDIAVIEIEANMWLATQPTAIQSSVLRARAVPAPKKVNEAVITLRSEDAVLRFNWVRGANMFGFMAALKGVCAPKDRSFNPTTKEWSFVLAQVPHLVEVIEAQEIFGTPRTVTPEKDLDRARELTPPNLYGSSRPTFHGKGRPWGGRNYGR